MLRDDNMIPAFYHICLHVPKGCKCIHIHTHAQLTVCSQVCMRGHTHTHTHTHTQISVLDSGMSPFGGVRMFTLMSCGGGHVR